MAEREYKYRRKRVKSVISLNFSKFYKNNLIRLRYKLDITLAKKKANLTVNFILMNPAKADCMQSDNTVTKIINYIFENKNNVDILKDTGRVVITNLYTIYAKDEKQLSNYIEEYGSVFAEGNFEEYTNDSTIYKTIEESDYLVLAWGCGKEIYDYDKRIHIVENIIRKSEKKDIYHIGELIDGKYPKHLSRFCYKEKLNKYEL